MARNARSKHARNRKRNLAAANSASPKTFAGKTAKPAATQAPAKASSTQLYKTPGKNTKTSNYTYKPAPVQGSMALWIMTPFGILMPAKRPAHLVKDGDTRTLQVRTRRSEYLDAFREQYCPTLGENEHHPDQDYQWKAAVDPDELALAVARMVLDTDTGKFKPLTNGPKGLKDKKLANDLHSMYTTLWSNQLKYGDGTSSYDSNWFKDPKTGGYTYGYHGSYAITGPEACKRWGHLWPEQTDGTYAQECSDCQAVNPEWPERPPGKVYPAGTTPPVNDGLDDYADDDETLPGDEMYPGEHKDWSDYREHELDGVLAKYDKEQSGVTYNDGSQPSMITGTWHRPEGKAFGHFRYLCTVESCGEDDPGQLTDYWHRMPASADGHVRYQCSQSRCGMDEFHKDYRFTDLDKGDGVPDEQDQQEENQPAAS